MRASSTMAPAASVTRTCTPLVSGSSAGPPLGMRKAALIDSFCLPGPTSSLLKITFGLVKPPATPREHGSSPPSAGGLNAAPTQKPSPSLSLSASAGHLSSRLQMPSPSGSTRWHVDEQQSLVPFAAPSSHCSPGLRMPLPQDSSRQFASQPSPATLLPSSHSSPGSRVPSPQTAGRSRVDGTHTTVGFCAASPSGPNSSCVATLRRTKRG